jgi:hypothetical protein
VSDDGAAAHGRPLCGCHEEPMTRRNDRLSGWRCSVAHRRARRAYYSANRAAEVYAVDRRRLRARIARKRQQIEELENRLET